MIQQTTNPYAGIQNFLNSRVLSAQSHGDKSATSEYWRKIDDLGLFSSLFGDPSSQIGKYFDTAAGNIGQRMSTEGARARQRGATAAYGGNYINPFAFSESFGRSAQEPFANALGSLESSRAQTQFGAQQATMQQLLQYLMGQQGMRQQQQQYNDQSGFDWSSLLPVFGSLGGAFLGGPLGASVFGGAGAAASK